MAGAKNYEGGWVLKLNSDGTVDWQKKYRSSFDFLKSIQDHPPQRVPGTAIFMSGDPGGVPRALLHNLKHNRILHERVLLMTVETEEIPYVSEEDRVLVEELGSGFYSVVILYGFAEDPDVPKILRQLPIDGYRDKPMESTFFLGQRTIVIPRRPKMAQSSLTSYVKARSQLR